MRWSEIPIHVVDFEGSRETGIVEYGVVSLAGGRIAAVSTRLCRPRAKLTAEDTRVHGLRTPDVAEADPFDAAWEQFAALRASGVFAAHFSGTENALLRAVWPCSRLSPDFLHPGRESSEWGPWIDTGRLASAVLPRGASAALADVIAHLGLVDRLAQHAQQWCPAQRCRYHCALYDALAAALVLEHLAREADGSAWSLARVVAASVGDRERRDDLVQGRLF